jgi:hypothetical protein
MAHRLKVAQAVELYLAKVEQEERHQSTLQQILDAVAAVVRQGIMPVQMAGLGLV